jgi:hypothetical protein
MSRLLPSRSGRGLIQAEGRSAHGLRGGVAGAVEPGLGNISTSVA